MLDYLYEKTWLSVVADLIPDWGTARGFDLLKMPGSIAEDLQSIAEDLELDAVLNRAWKFARKDGGGAVVMVIEDGKPSNAPVDRANIWRVKKLVALDRWELTITRWGAEGDVVGPLEYQDQSGAKWHHTRVVPFYNRELPLRRRPYYDYWSLGEYDRVYAEFLRDQDVQEALGKLLKEYSYDVLKLNGIRSQSKDEIKKALVGIGLGIQKIGKIALDANDDYVTQTKTLAGLPDSVKLITARLAMIVRIPASILLFENPGGLNSGANAGDWESLLGQVEADQRKHYVPAVVAILSNVLASREGPTAGRPVVERWRVQPRPLGRLSPQAQSQVRSANAAARASDVQNGIITVEEARRDKELVADYSIEETPELAPVEPAAGDPAARLADDEDEPAEPEPTPGQPPLGENLVTAAQVRERYGVGLGSLKSMVMKRRIRGWRFPSGWRFLESEVASAGLHEPPEPEGDGSSSA